MKIRKKELELYTVWGIYLFAYMWLVMSELAFTYNNTSDIFAFVRNATFIMLLLIILQNKYKVKTFIQVGLFALIITMGVLFSHSLSFLMILVLGLAIGDVDFRKFVIFDYRLKIVILASIVICCKLGLINNYTAVINGIEKQSLGFSHPNTLGLFVSIIIVEWLYIHYNTLRFKNIVCIFIITMGLYYIGTSRTSWILLLFVTGRSLLLRNREICNLMQNRIIKRVLSLLPIIVCLLCYGGAIAYTKSSLMWNVIDKFFTTRIYWANYYLKTYGLNLFGRSLNTTSARSAMLIGAAQSNSLDMAYVRIGIQYGVIILLFFVLALVILQKYAIRTKNWGLLIANTFFVVLGAVENSIYSVAMNVFLICVIYAIGGNLSKENTCESEGIL